jgi:hypothetical protein
MNIYSYYLFYTLTQTHTHTHTSYLPAATFFGQFYIIVFGIQRVLIVVGLFGVVNVEDELC